MDMYEFFNKMDMSHRSIMPMARRAWLLALACWITSSSLAAALCPQKCTCYLDNKGRNAVLCKDGGMTGPLTLSDMSPETEVLKITAPEDNTNMLTMSPVFQSYKKLEEIHITRSNIPQLGLHFFWGLNKLDILDLSQNNITQPLHNNFRGLSHLKELYLDDNRILSLPSGTFQFLMELKVLSIQRNRISELMPSLFLQIAKLKVLKLSGNNLKDINPIVFKDIQELKSLECRSCGLSKIDKEVYELLPHLNHLDLGDNELSSLSVDELKPLKNLKTLKLDGNRITAIKSSSVFFNQHELKRLNLGRNRITKISLDAFDNLHNLTELDLSSNKFDGDDDDFGNDNNFMSSVASTLEVLVLNGNNHLSIEHFRKLLNKLNVLKELDLENCGLVDLTEIHRGFVPPSVRILNLANNHLSSISSESIPERLQELDVSNNRLRGLDEDLLGRIEGVRSLKLDGNPWSCDLCHIIPLLERVNRSSAISSVKCQQPYSAKGKRLGILQRNELTWCTVPSYTTGDANFFLLGDDGRIGLIAAGSSVCLLFLTVAAVLAALCYSRRHAAKYYTHEDKLAMEGDSIFDNNHSPLFCEDRELSFKFPLDTNGIERKVSVSTIDEIKKEHSITNGT